MPRSLPLRRNLDRVHEIEERLPVLRGVGHLGEVHVYPVTVADEVARDMALRHRAPLEVRQLVFDVEFEEGKPIPLESSYTPGVRHGGVSGPPVAFPALLSRGTHFDGSM